MLYILLYYVNSTDHHSSFHLVICYSISYLYACFWYYFSAFITLILWYTLRSESMVNLASPFLIVVFTLRVTFWIHVIFRIVLSRCVQTKIGNFVEIAWNQYIGLSNIHIFVLLINQSIKKYVIPYHRFFFQLFSSKKLDVLIIILSNMRQTEEGRPVVAKAALVLYACLKIRLCYWCHLC